MTLADSGVAKGVAAVGVALFALYVIGTWDDKAEAPPVATRVANPGAPPIANPDASQAVKPSAPQVALRAPTELWGIRLGDKFEAYAASHGPFDKDAARPASFRKQAGDEDFVQRNGQLRVGVRKGLVSSVAYSCKENRDPTAMYKVACHAGPERIKAVFGDRVRVLCPKLKANDPNKDLAAFVRAFDVVEVQTRYIVIKDAMTGFIVFEPGELETLAGINWEKCR
ncbi:MAG TPA: hypothetical protein VHP62_00900 [Usitatibacter sp.]|nr:hypothetical protein [Usitatibacter sp.]